MSPHETWICPGDARLRLVAGDICSLPVDALVNAANVRLAGGGGVDGAIHRAAGPELAHACAAIRASQGGCPTGQAVATPGFRLPARWIIHTVGPVWSGSTEDALLLAGCYRSSLDLALRLGARTVAFPNISTGVYGYPKDAAARIAVAAVRDWLDKGPQEAVPPPGAADFTVFFVCLDPENLGLYRELLGA